MSSEAFLSRWSRRKQAVRTAEQSSEESSRPERDVSASEPHEPAVPGQEPETIPAPEPELGADEIAALPPIEELTAETDISLFLRRGVPEPLRNAALRRMWSLDPKIRDFVGDAREYAYDWNTPGGVPGHGPLAATDDVVRMAARIVSGEPPIPVFMDDQAGGADNQSTIREQLSAAGPNAGAQHAPTPFPEGTPASAREDRRRTAAEDIGAVSSGEIKHGIDTSEPDAGTRSEPAGEPSGPAARRHGGAMPL